MNRRRLLFTVSVLALAAAVPAFAIEGVAIRAEVPFSFHAGKLLFPSGSYVFTVDSPDQPELLTIRDQNGKEHEVMLTVPEHARKGPAKETKLVFNRYGTDSFLSQIWVTGMDEVREVPKSEIGRERAELAAHGGSVSLPGHVDR